MDGDLQDGSIRWQEVKEVVVARKPSNKTKRCSEGASGLPLEGSKPATDFHPLDRDTHLQCKKIQAP